MIVIRPITLEDLDPLLELTKVVGFGLTTLPQDRQLLRRRILDSQHGFERLEDERARGETYLFVMEDLKTGKVVGTSGIVSKVGGFEPFYAYKIETAIHESDTLGVRKEVRFLKLVTEHNGPCEIGSLFLSPEYRKDGNGRLLSLGRFLFIADHRQFCDDTVIAEMRGVIDEQGGSVFWDALGKHFFDIDFPKADYLSMVNKKFIADLMPTHPIYIPLLPQAAQDVIGQVHEQTKPAMRILEDEGFKFCGMVDIFEAGPVVSCPRDKIRTVRESVTSVVEDITDAPIQSDLYVIGNARRDFRACKGPLQTGAGGVRLTSPTALALKVRVGDAVRYAMMRPGKTEEGRS